MKSNTGTPSLAILGFTLIELIVATAILVILTSLALPLARVTIEREKERELRHVLWQMRDGSTTTKMPLTVPHFRSRLNLKAIRRISTHWSNGVDVGGKKMRLCAEKPSPELSRRALAADTRYAHASRAAGRASSWREGRCWNGPRRTKSGGWILYTMRWSAGEPSAC